MAEHKQGEMNIESQERMFDAFVKFTTWTVIVILVVLVGMALFIT